MHSTSFKEDIRRRGWVKRCDSVATHVLLDGGALCIPDQENSKFLNVLFAATLRKDSFCVVEQKTPVFKMFFDIDAKFRGTGRTPDIVHAEKSMCLWMHVFCTTSFFAAGKNQRMIVCTAPAKHDQCGEIVKCGMHIYFPGITTNPAIAIACRRAMLQQLEESPPEMGRGGQFLANSWADVVDEAVFKGSGLRTVYAHKGRHEKRAYVPKWVVEADEMGGEPRVVELPDPLPPEDRRDMIHECSIRVFHHNVTPTVNGEHEQADQENSHSVGGRAVSGRSTSIQVYEDALPALLSRLPKQYQKMSFVRAFVSTHAVYLKSTCKYCMNVGREHNTSTVYVQVTKQGAAVRCYCRKEEYNCAEYASPIIPLPRETLEIFFPDVGTGAFLPDVQTSKSTMQKEKSVRFLAGRCFDPSVKKRQCKKKRF